MVFKRIYYQIILITILLTASVFSQTKPEDNYIVISPTYVYTEPAQKYKLDYGGKALGLDCSILFQLTQKSFMYLTPGLRFWSQYSIDNSTDKYSFIQIPICFGATWFWTKMNKGGPFAKVGGNILISIYDFSYPSAPELNSSGLKLGLGLHAGVGFNAFFTKTSAIVPEFVLNFNTVGFFKVFCEFKLGYMTSI